MELKTPSSREAPVTRAASLELTGLIKLAYFVIVFASIAYFLLHKHSGLTLSAAADQASMGLLYGVLLLVLVFGIAVVGFSLHKGR